MILVQTRIAFGTPAGIRVIRGPEPTRRAQLARSGISNHVLTSRTGRTRRFAYFAQCTLPNIARRTLLLISAVAIRVRIAFSAQGESAAVTILAWDTRKAECLPSLILVQTRIAFGTPA